MVKACRWLMESNRQPTVTGCSPGAGDVVPRHVCNARQRHRFAWLEARRRYLTKWRNMATLPLRCRGLGVREHGLATLRLVFTISIVAGVLSMGVGLVAAGYDWLTPPATIRPLPERPVPASNRPPQGSSRVAWLAPDAIGERATPAVVVKA